MASFFASNLITSNCFENRLSKVVPVPTQVTKLSWCLYITRVPDTSLSFDCHINTDEKISAYSSFGGLAALIGRHQFFEES